MPMYTVKSRLASIGRDYAVENEKGEIVYEVDGKVRFGRTFLVKDDSGKTLLRATEKLLSVDPMFVIKRDADVAAMVHRTTTSDAPTAKYEIEVGGRKELDASGSFLDDGIHIRREGVEVGSISREPNTVVNEIFHVNTVTGEDQPLLLAVAMSIVECTWARGETANA